MAFSFIVDAITAHFFTAVSLDRIVAISQAESQTEG